MIRYRPTQALYALFCLGIITFNSAASAQDISPVATQSTASQGIAGSLAEKNLKDINHDLINLGNSLLNNKEFIENLKIKLKDAFSSNISTKDVESIMQNYLLSHPEFLVRVQEALTKKQEEQEALARTKIIQTNADKIFHSTQDAIIGNTKGSKTLVQFFDYNCGFCKSSASIIADLIHQHPELRIVLKDLPIFGENSKKVHLLARAFYALKPEKYLDFYLKILGEKEKVDDKEAMRVATSFGVTEAALLEKVKSLQESMNAYFKQNLNLAYMLGLNGTPSYIIGTQAFIGAIDKATLDAKIKMVQHK